MTLTTELVRELKDEPKCEMSCHVNVNNHVCDVTSEHVVVSEPAYFMCKQLNNYANLWSSPSKNRI